STKSSRATVASPASNATEKSSEPTEGTAETSAKKPKFKPAKPGPTIRRSADTDDAPTGKSLTQVPPQDLLEVDDGILAELERETDAELIAERPATTRNVPRVARTERETTSPAEPASNSAAPDSHKTAD
ncbi:MAG TPA: hypothetical protein VK137_19625, partial [Planctomycetaceae bacterium]|nr:hypothetical protein [Planctomycetaceae bacterium]